MLHVQAVASMACNDSQVVGKQFATHLYFSILVNLRKNEPGGNDISSFVMIATTF